MVDCQPPENNGGFRTISNRLDVRRIVKVSAKWADQSRHWKVTFKTRSVSEGKNLRSTQGPGEKLYVILYNNSIVVWVFFESDAAWQDF